MSLLLRTIVLLAVRAHVCNPNTHKDEAGGLTCLRRVWATEETLLQKFKSEGGVEFHSHIRGFSEQMGNVRREGSRKERGTILSRLPLLLLGGIWETDFPLTSWPSAQNTGFTLDCSDRSGAFLCLPFT